MAICKTCGQSIDDNARFCWACGAKVEPQAAPEEEQVPHEEPVIAEKEPEAPHEERKETVSEADAPRDAGEPVWEAEPAPLWEQKAEPVWEEPENAWEQRGPRKSPAPPAPPVWEEQEKPEKDAVIGTGGYFVTLLLLCIPVLNLILAAIWALGGTGRTNRRNLARGYLLLVLVVMVALSAAYLLIYLLAPELVLKFNQLIRNLAGVLF